VNRFLRSALFPVVVITLIVWLGTQTLLSHKQKTTKKTLSGLITLVRTNPSSIGEVVFSPNKQQIAVQLTSGEKFNVYYPTEQSQADLQKKLDDQYFRAVILGKDIHYNSTWGPWYDEVDFGKGFIDHVLANYELVDHHKGTLYMDYFVYRPRKKNPPGQ